MIAEFPDGTRLVLMVNATPIRSVDGNVESVVLAAQDLTPQAEAERLRTEFLGMIGHELRSPLAAIKGSATTLLQSESSLDPAEMVQFFRIIDEQSDYMRDLLSDLIDVVRIETGTLPVTPAPTEMARLVEEARNTFMGAGGRENIHIDLPFDLPPVMADRRRIVQVVSNLLANASRNSHDGSAIRVEAGARRRARLRLRRRQRPGRHGRAASPPVREVLPLRWLQPGTRPWSGPGHLQGDRGGTRRADLG